VDALLDDPAFVESYRAHFDPQHGRPSTSIETYLRMMFLKFRHKLSYEVLCREVAESAQVVDNVDGVVVDHRVVVGNPPDAPMLAPAVARIKALVGRAPRAVTADRIYGEASVEDELKGMGVKTVVIPRKGKPGAPRRQVQGRRSFRKLVKLRTGCEGRISHLKHAYAWNRTLLDGIGGAQTWCGLGVLAHNTAKISALIDAKGTTPPVSAPSRPASTARTKAPPGPPPPPATPMFD
jgi:IS5 family transposase